MIAVTNLCDKTFDESIDHLIGTVGSKLRVDECEKEDSVEVEVLANEAVGADIHQKAYYLVVQIGWNEAVSSEEHLETKVEHSNGSQNEHKDEPEVEADVELLDDHVEDHDARHSVLMLLSKITNFEVTEYNAREDAVVFFGSSLELNVPEMEETPEIVVDVEEVLEKNHLEDAVDDESKLEEEVDVRLLVEHVPNVVWKNEHGGLQQENKWNPSVVVDVTISSGLISHFSPVWHKVGVLDEAEVVHVPIPTTGKLSWGPALDRLSKVLLAGDGQRHSNKNEWSEPSIDTVDGVVGKLALLLTQHSSQMIIDGTKESQHF